MLSRVGGFWTRLLRLRTGAGSAAGSAGAVGGVSGANGGARAAGADDAAGGGGGGVIVRGRCRSLRGGIGLFVASDCRIAPSGVHSVTGASEQNGWHCLKKQRFRRVHLPDPSSRTTYCPLSRTSAMVPDLSQRVGCGPVWFWTRTVVPTFSFGSDLTCSLYLSMLSR
jgi:hypothetical protein